MKNFLRKFLGQKLINYYHLAGAILANFIYGFPSRKLHVIGVTGTDGKTTTVNLVASILKAAGLPVSFLSTINAQIGRQALDTGLHTTTPSSFLLQRLLQQMVKAGSQYAVLEVTSHALDQYRTWGITFETAVITNVTHEHLDYHKTYGEYLRAKAKVFKNVKYAVLNREDKSYEQLLKLISTSLPLSPPARPKLAEGGSPGDGLSFRSSSPSDGEELKERLLTYGFSSRAQIWASDINESLEGSKLSVHTPAGGFPIELSLPGQFNVKNALAAIAVATAYKIPVASIQKGLSQIKTVSGRMEFLETKAPFLVLVDFAHTPNGLRELLSFLRPKVSGSIIMVFGAAGERDSTKRPLMGSAADEFANSIVLTREDNRSEPAEKICQEIASGVKNKRLNTDLFIIPDRREAIRFALNQAKSGDLVAITGKGHEQSLNVDGVELPWDEREVAREELKKLGVSR